jgi:hypothetical protein
VRGQTNVSKVHTLKCAAYNLGLLLRKVWGYRKPRNADAGAWGPFFGFLGLLAATTLIVCGVTQTGQTRDWGSWSLMLVTFLVVHKIWSRQRSWEKACFLTG